MKWEKQCTYESVSLSCPTSRENLNTGSDDLENNCFLLSLKCCLPTFEIGCHHVLFHSGGWNVFVTSVVFSVPLTEIRTQSMDTSSRSSTSILDPHWRRRYSYFQRLVLTDGVSWCDPVTDPVSPQEWVLVSQSLTDLHPHCCCSVPRHYTLGCQEVTRVGGWSTSWPLLHHCGGNEPRVTRS